MNKTTNTTRMVERILASKSEVIKMGVDQHAGDVVVSVQEDGSVPQRAQKMQAEGLVSVAKRLVEAGKKVHVCYEAGPCGYWLYRRLVKEGVNVYVVVPKTMGGAKQQKTDGLDAQALCDALDRYLRGNRKAFTVVRVPSEQEEQARTRGRLRGQLQEERNAWSARGRSAALLEGHQLKGAWWAPRCWKKTSEGLPAWLVNNLEQIRKILLAIEEQEKQLREELEAAAPEQLPKAVGALTWVLLTREVCSWGRFKNRRQVAGFTGLCPGVAQSGTTHRDGHINRCGNPRIRKMLIEMVWRLVRWQPDYKPVKKLVEGVVKGAARRKLAVAAARRLAIDLWRLATGATTAQALQLNVPALAFNPQA